MLEICFEIYYRENGMHCVWRNRREELGTETQISHKLVVLGYIVDGFGSLWLVLLVVVGGFGWFRVLVTTDTLMQSFLVGKNAYPNESRKFEAFRYIRRCLHRNLFYLISEKWTLSWQNELQMFSSITGQHQLGVSLKNSINDGAY